MSLVISQPVANLLTISAAQPEFTGLSSTSSFITVDVALTTANQVYDIASLSLDAGTWLVLGQCQFYSAASGVSQYSCRLLNASSGAILSSTSTTAPSQVTATANGNCGAIITLSATTTIKLQAVASQNTRTVRYQSFPGNYDNASGMQAVRIA
jgi:hypothetical protein